MSLYKKISAVAILSLVFIFFQNFSSTTSISDSGLTYAGVHFMPAALAPPALKKVGYECELRGTDVYCGRNYAFHRVDALPGTKQILQGNAHAFKHSPYLTWGYIDYCSLSFAGRLHCWAEERENRPTQLLQPRDVDLIFQIQGGEVPCYGKAGKFSCLIFARGYDYAGMGEKPVDFGSATQVYDNHLIVDNLGLSYSFQVDKGTVNYPHSFKMKQPGDNIQVYDFSTSQPVYCFENVTDIGDEGYDMRSELGVGTLYCGTTAKWQDLAAHPTFMLKFDGSIGENSQLRSYDIDQRRACAQKALGLLRQNIPVGTIYSIGFRFVIAGVNNHGVQQFNCN